MNMMEMMIANSFTPFYSFVTPIRPTTITNAKVRLACVFSWSKALRHEDIRMWIGWVATCIFTVMLEGIGRSATFPFFITPVKITPNTYRIRW